jgi:cytochrome c-type biogenesis protein CcmH/NrfG
MGWDARQVAVVDFRRAVDLDPKQIYWWVKLSHLLVSSGRPAEAVEAFRNACARR